MRLHLFALALATALPIVTTAQTSTTQAGAPSGPPPATLPATALGRLAQRLLDVVERGDSSDIAGFVQQHLGRDVRGRTPAQMAALLVKLHRQSNGLRVERAMMAQSALRMMARSNQGNRLLGMELEPAPGDTTRIASITMMAMDERQMSGPPKPWAEGSLTDEQIAQVIRTKVKEAAD